MPIMCFVVDTGDGVLVFDTGLHESCCGTGADATDRYGRLLDSFEPVCLRTAMIDARLQQAGFAVDDVRWVTNSHLHFDHSGSNAMFPAATQLVRRREIDYARARLLKPSGFVAADIEWLDATSGSPWDYDERHEIVPGLSLVDASGHTPGHQALEVEFTDGRRFVCFGDAAYTLEAVADVTPTGYSANADWAIATLHRLRDAQANGAVLLSGHDVEQWQDVADLVLVHDA
jgi:glyoxylase-like metal-dependent hydrolase (beta-lactamase superfamily II)